MHLSIAQQKPVAKMQQRAHERFNVKVPGVMRLPETRNAIYIITVLDASKNGMRVSCPVAIAVGTRVEVKALGSAMSGVARYAREVDHEFNVGIEVDRINNQAEEFDVTAVFRSARPASSRTI